MAAVQQCPRYCTKYGCIIMILAEWRRRAILPASFIENTLTRLECMKQTRQKEQLLYANMPTPSDPAVTLHAW
jgi:hypothetical protein